MAAAVANLIATVTGQNVLDNGVLTTLIELLCMAINASTWCGTSGGTANAQTLTPVIAQTAYVPGAQSRFIAGFTNTGATTLNISGVGAIAINKRTPLGLVPLTGGEIISGTMQSVVYDGTVFELGVSAPIPSLTLKEGSNAGDYTTSSSGLANVDGTNLSFTVTIPLGWKLLVMVTGTEGFTGSHAAAMLLAIADGGTPVTQHTQEFSAGGSPAAQPFALNWIINGDGASHTVTLQWASPGSNAAVMRNSSGNIPVMTFMLTPSN
jgi:hypothetical protein